MAGQIRLRVVGSGPVALAFALFARRQGFGPGRLRLEQFDAPPSPALAARQLAMSLGSWQLLARIARAPQAAAIDTVDVSLLGHPGRTRITAREMRAPALGYVLRYAAILGVLQRAALEAGLSDHAPGTEAADSDELVVHAEGDTGDRAAVLAFEQAALLAEVAVEHPREGIAFECFTAHGPLALLPLPEPNRCSLVWCGPPEESRRRAALDAEALQAELQRAFGWTLGRLSVVTPCTVAPMVRRARREITAPGEAWIGNAAQALHPVGGQGLNLGLRDAFLLAACLGEADESGRDVAWALDRYRGRRRVDRSGTIALTDTLARAFGFAPLRPVQSVALAALDLALPARAALARQFMFGVRA